MAIKFALIAVIAQCTHLQITLIQSRSMSATWSDKRKVCLLSLAYLHMKEKKKQLKSKQKKRFWVRTIYRNKCYSEYHNLVQELRLDDREFHHRYLRMSKERFDHLFSLVEHLIHKKDTYFRQAIPARERLVLTLRYLATGSSQQTLS